MYAGASRAGLGCACDGGGLGLAPAVVAAVIPAAESVFRSIFGSAFPQEKATIDGYAQQVVTTSDPALRYYRYVQLRCLAGDESIVAEWNRINAGKGPTVAAGQCGCGSDKCLGYAQQIVAQIDSRMTVQPTSAAPVIVPPVLAASGSSPSASGTIYAAVPGGGGVSVPVPASSILNATLFGLPISVLALGGLVLAFAGGHSRGGRR